MNALPGSILLAPTVGGNVPLIGVVVAGWMYWLGGRRMRSASWRSAVGEGRASLQRWQAVSFAAGLVTVVLALQEPMDGLADELFFAHMVQHVLLMMVAAPLLVLAAPWMRLWRAFPLGLRRPVAGALARDRWSAPLRALAGLLGLPIAAWILFNADMLAWHIPAAYDLTLRSGAAHYAEHATFLLLGLVAWAKVIDSPPYRSRLDAPQRVAFSLGSMIVGWLLALPLAFAKTAWYSAYADLHSRPGGISAIADQHLAAGVMWVPASVPWSVAIFILIYQWVSDGGRGAVRGIRAAPPADMPPARPAGEEVPMVQTARRVHA